MGNRGRAFCRIDFGELAGEVAVFGVGSCVDERVDASLTCLRRDEHHGMVWYLEPIGLPAMLLYTFDFRPLEQNRRVSGFLRSSNASKVQERPVAIMNVWSRFTMAGTAPLR